MRAHTGEILFLSGPLQAPERLISTAEHSHPGKRTQKEIADGIIKASG